MKVSGTTSASKTSGTALNPLAAAAASADSSGISSAALTSGTSDASATRLAGAPSVARPSAALFSRKSSYCGAAVA
jgi:hypothetical protein